MIDGYVVTNASVHDSQPLDDLLNQNDEDQISHADSAYSGESCAEIIAKHKLVGQINEKGYKNKPLTDEQKPPIEKRRRSEHGWSMFLDLWSRA